jgi:hypothetical protein
MSSYHDAPVATAAVPKHRINVLGCPLGPDTSAYVAGLVFAAAAGVERTVWESDHANLAFLLVSCLFLHVCL